MKTFTMDSENNITVYASMQEAKTSNQTDAVLFTTQDELAKLAAHWPTHRLVDVWNSLPGFTPVKKFTDRKTAIARIWKAIQSLEPAAEAPKTATSSRDVATGRAAKNKSGRNAKAEKAPATDAKAPREGLPVRSTQTGSKNATILELLRRPEGATLNDLTAATGWQAHSVRGFLSAVVGKKLGLKLESRKRDDGQRVYSIS